MRISEQIPGRIPREVLWEIPGCIPKTGRISGRIPRENIGTVPWGILGGISRENVGWNLRAIRGWTPCKLLGVLPEKKCLEEFLKKFKKKI